MSKLFALEELEEQLDQAELETSPEEGEVADVETEVEADVADIDSVEDAVEDGVESADVLEQVEDVIEDSLEEGEGLDPVAAEAIRIAIESVCVRLGAKSERMYAMYATENFRSASSRKHNTRIALEGVKDFLTALWEKIKAAVSSVWDKVVAFWNKHISNLGRVLKALEAAKSKVSALKGSSNVSDEVKASSSLQTAFPGKGDLDDKAIAAFIGAHQTTRGELDKLVATGVETLNQNATSPESLLKHIQGLPKGTKVAFANEAKPLVGGVWFELEEEFENAADSEEDSMKYNLEITENKETGDVDRELFIASKDGMKSLLTDTIKLIKDTIKARDKVEKNFRDFDKAKKAMDKAVTAMPAGKDDEKKARRKTAQALRVWSTANSKVPSFAAKVAALDVVLAKNVIGYCNACAKTYK